MSTISTVEPDWLVLRGGADDAARSGALAAALAGLLRAGAVTIHDLGSGAGAMTRWLAPRLAGAQAWVLHDGDPGILGHLDLEGVTDADGGAIVSAVSVEDLADLPVDAFSGAGAVTASALLDVVTEAEASRIVAACVAAGAPAFFSLTVAGSVAFDPAEPLDAELGAAFDDHQRRVRDGRRLLGPDAVPVIARLFADAGWRVRIASTPWRLGPAHADLMAAWLDGWLDAATEQRPDLAPAAAGFRARRRAQAAAGILAVTVAHEDLLAWPR